MPIIPAIGTKGNPSAVPPAIRRKNGAAFKSADTLAVFNGTTRRTLLRFIDDSGGSSWEKAPYCTPSGSHHSALAVKVHSIKGSPISAFDISPP